MSHHLHLLSLAYGVSMAPSRKAAIDQAVRSWVAARTNGLAPIGVETFLRLTEVALKRRCWNYAAHVAEIRAEFSKMVGDKP